MSPWVMEVTVLPMQNSSHAYQDGKSTYASGTTQMRSLLHFVMQVLELQLEQGCAEAQESASCCRKH